MYLAFAQSKGAAMDIATLDRYFTEHGVVYLPWIGNHYEQGFNGRQLLVLGESHYDEWDGEKHALPPEFTRSCIKEVVNREKDCAVFWRFIEQALLNESRDRGWAPGGGHPLWDRLSFYNFVQLPISGRARVRPRWELFEASRKPFRAVLEKIRPERVLVCGKGLWEGMEEVTEAEDYLHDDIQAYRLDDGTKVWCLATVHPSSGRYSWAHLHPLIMAFFDNPNTAAKLLKAD